LNAPLFIEFMSLDTEGSELHILKGVDLSRYTFGYMAIEHNHESEKRAAIRSYLEANGYVHIRENVVDDDYAHESVASDILGRIV